MSDSIPIQPATQPGDVFELMIQDIAFGGSGVARINDLVVFVPFVMVGERVKAEIVSVKKSFAHARLLHVLEPSSHRVEPECPYFGRCGGCQYQHMEYSTQLEVKQRQVRENFIRIGGFENPPVRPVIPCPTPYGYRNRIMVRSQYNKSAGRLFIGFLGMDKNLVVDIESCAISEPAINEQLNALRKQPPERGGLKTVLRIMPEDWQLPGDSFFQNNFHLLPELTATVRQCLESAGARYLIDAYCGVGFFALEAAGSVEKFVGIEIDKQAIRAARENARQRDVHNGDFITAPTEDWLPDLLKRFPREETAVILDPPRVGCAPEAMDQLREERPWQIVYVSCHPSTLARDLKRLCEDGAYRLESVTPLDMFPQTQHVECVVDLRSCCK